MVHKWMIDIDKGTTINDVKTVLDVNEFILTVHVYVLRFRCCQLYFSK